MQEILFNLIEACPITLKLPSLVQANTRLNLLAYFKVDKSTMIEIYINNSNID